MGPADPPPLLARYRLPSLEHLHNALFDPGESCNYHRAYSTTHAPLPTQTAQLSEQLSYRQLMDLYSRDANQLPEAKRILRRKYYHQDVVRAHQQHKALWLLCSGATHQMQEEPDYYQLLGEAEYPEFYRKVIEADVRRTLQEKTEESQAKLGRILRNLAKRNPYVGYCQGLNFVVNFLLVMQFEERECFWLARMLLEDTVPHNYYTNMLGVAVDLKLVEVYLRLKRPALYDKLQRLTVSVSIFALEWLVCLFTTVLPYCTLVLLWDFLVLQGSVALLRACILLIDELQPFIMGCRDLTDFLSQLDSAKRELCLEEGRFVERMKTLFIDPWLLPVARAVYESLLVGETKAGGKKVASIACDPGWPICHQLLQRQKVQQAECEVWVFKEEGAPKLIDDYLDTKLRTQKNFRQQDTRNPHKKLMIGRLPHICDPLAYQLLRAPTSIELSDYDSQTRTFELSTPGLNETALKFLRSATFVNETFIFQQPQ